MMASATAMVKNVIIRMLNRPALRVRVRYSRSTLNVNKVSEPTSATQLVMMAISI
jgi:hypothetical protein